MGTFMHFSQLFRTLSIFFLLQDVLFQTNNTSFQVSSPLDCAVHCAAMSSCGSFFYQPNLVMCVLQGNSLKCSDNRMIESNDVVYYWKKTKMTWTPHTCSEVLKNDPNAEDGEYRLFPRAPQFRGQPVKIYCKMTGKIPNEYISLVNKNYGVYPDLKDMGSCNVTTPLGRNVQKRAGETYHTKIRVLPQNMSVAIGDVTFSTTTRRESFDRAYGRALDCFSSACDPKGTFFINTLGTGMKFSQQLTWKGLGYKPTQSHVERKEGGAVINLRCGGRCGGCTPEGDIVLYPNPLDETYQTMFAVVLGMKRSKAKFDRL